MIDLKGKVAVILGVANKRSIAYAIAEKLAGAGATLVLGYQSERLKKEADELIESLGQTGKGKTIQLDVTSDEQIDAAFAEIAASFPAIHTLVHSLAFAPADAMKQDFLLTKRADFALALDISAYSLIAVSRAAAPLMSEGGSIITLTHFGSTVTFPNYNVMGVAKAGLEASVRYLAASLGGKNIRVNAISAGAIKTLAARGIGDLQTMLDRTQDRAPLHRNVEQAEVGNTALFLASDLSSAITGEVMFVDCGFNITGI